ncbi:MAG TPA: cytochrome c maturation protein CcmE [Saprospiraceae bacterium]|nr:cytochrome c maturation protein CcmE [Saprospiraceae bacterium]HRO09287.1 cytochrome c maturation protein CcmE [Saprospiraceae bacterium]HRO72572.1 cytochrome c maturation protein CcmE [Saprospiraceae bacterium]HRP42319.1 cytochrome c maturation protein CcmE [Saprospiraceae bacterium]
MNRSLIISFVLILAGIGVFISASKDVSTYANFKQAANGGKVKIVGQLAKDMPMTYDPQNKPNEFEFFLTDEQKTVKKVILHQPKPQDFEMSEQIVVTGELKDDVFNASEILMKCPSKYKNEEIAIKNEVSGL